MIFFLLGDLKAWLKAKSIFTERMVKVFFYVTFREIIFRGRKAFSCKKLLCWYNTYSSRRNLLLFVAYGSTSTNWDYLYKLRLYSKGHDSAYPSPCDYKGSVFTLNTCKSNYRIRDWESWTLLRGNTSIILRCLFST